MARTVLRSGKLSGLYRTSEVVPEMIAGPAAFEPFIVGPAGYNECVTPSNITTSDDTPMSKIFHPLLALIASATDRELAKYVEYLKHENKLLRARLPKQVHTSHEERQTLLKYGKVIGRAIEELVTIVSPATFYRWVREEKNGKPKPENPKGGQRKPKELRELVLKIAEETGFGLTRIVGELRKLGIKNISRQRRREAHPRQVRHEQSAGRLRPRPEREKRRQDRAA